MSAWKLSHLRHLEKFSISVILLMTFRFAFQIVDRILDLLIGYTITYGWRKDRERALNDYDHSAQIVSVLFRGAFSITQMIQLDNFLYRHVNYVNPRFILNHDNVVLFGVTPTHAFFSVTLDPAKDVLDTAKAPFMSFFAYTWTEQLVIVPLKTFHRLARELGDPSHKDVTILNTTGRCGSTLLCQIMSRVPNVRTLSEPWPLTNAHAHHVKGRITTEELREIVQSCVRLQCKPENNARKEIERVFIKLSRFVTHLQPMIQDLFPSFKFIFLARHHNDVMRSWLKFSRNLPSFYINTPVWFELCVGLVPIAFGDEEWKERREDWLGRMTPDMLLQGMTLVYAANMSCFVRNKENYHHVMIYEDILADPKSQLKKVFAVMGIEEEHLEKGMSAMRFDSQKGMFGGIGKTNVIDHEVWSGLDEILEECEVDLTSKSRLEHLRGYLGIKRFEVEGIPG